MCGIFAVFDLDSRSAHLQTLMKMSNSLAHREPDDCGLIYLELRGNKRVISDEQILDEDGRPRLY
jgi:asparagine synthetase B (glutamine-hydrolysing)